MEKITDNVYGQFLPGITKVLLYKNNLKDLEIWQSLEGIIGEELAEIGDKIRLERLYKELTTKVSDYLIDSKVSMAEKSRQFVLLSGGEIVWLVGRRISDTARLTRHSEQVLKITKENL